MVVEALRAYVQLASGLTDVTRERAVSAAKALVAQVGAMSDAPAESTAQVRALADELAKMARTNRDVVVGMVRSETERAVASVGAASHEEVVALQLRVSALEAALSLHDAASEPAASARASDLDEQEVDTVETARPPADPAHATPADMPRHEPEHPVDPPSEGAPADDAPEEGAAAEGSAPESTTTSGDDAAAAPQDPSPPDVSTS